MKSDRFLYAPGGLAIGKGLAYLFAFCTGLLAISATEQAYYFAIIIYCCGCICDYIESYLPSTGKCDTVRNISLIAFIVIAIVAIAAFAGLSKSSTLEWANITKFIAKHQFWFSLFLALLWVVPLFSGIIQCFSCRKKKTHPRPPGKSLFGYSLITKDK